jgi:xanthine dehydrogenase YagR molybdenum-binding subunit
MAERTVAWKPRSENKIIGTDVPKVDGIEKASGHAKYAADVNTKGTLYARLLTCKHAAAKVAKLNVEPAKAIKGVHAVHVFRDAGSEVRHDGTLIAAVAAETTDLAQDGVNAIEVEYEVLDHFVDDDDFEGAQQADRLGPPRSTDKGNVEEALKNAKAVHEGYYGVNVITHCCLESHGAHAEFKNGDTLDVHLSTQNVSGTPGQFAGPLGVDASKVTVHCEYIGGGFGSKFSVDEWGLAAASLAKEAGRPVRLMLDRPTELKTAGQRPSGFAKVTIAANENGEVVAWKSEHWGSNGMGGGTVDVNQYPYPFDGFPNISRKATGIRTNTGDQRAWRAPNHPQLCAMTQTAMDDVAAKLGMNSLDFFLANLKYTAKADVYRAELLRAAELIGWKDKWHAHGKGPKRNGKATGLGLALHRWGGRANNSGVKLKVHPDGSVTCNSGTQDLGTGTRTVIAMVLAETFGLPVEAVKVNIGSSQYPQSGGSGGSTTVGGVSGPARRAGLEALWKIYDLVAARYKVEADSLSAGGGKIWSGEKEVCSWKQAASLTGPMGLEAESSGAKNDGLTSDGVGGVQMAEVEVDTETGVVRMKKMVAVQDCGLIVNELLAKSQVEGALIMGIAYALSEERIMDNETGRFINADLENYKLSRIGDVGELVVEMFQPDEEYQRGVIGLGEPPVIAPGAAISNAVANAIGVRVPVLPLTPQRVLDALSKGGTT